MTSTTSTAGSRIRGLLAAAFTLILLVGLPLALVAVGADPIPDRLPAWNEVSRVLNQPATDPTWLIVVLIVVAWAAWAVFALSFVIELITSLRGTSVKAVHALSPRGTARGLIAAMALLATPVAPITAFAMEPEAVAAQPAPPTSVSAREAQVAPVVPASQATRVTPVHQRSQSKSFESYEVERGDTLWEIADEELDDGARFDEIYRASASTIQPDGKILSDPDHIEPGWQLKVPVDREDTKTPGAPAKPPTDSTEGHSSNSAAKPPMPQLEEPAPGVKRPETTTPVPAEPPAHENIDGQIGETDTPPAQFQTYEDDDLWGLRTASGVGALLAAGLGASLVARRMIQRRNRRPGQLIPLLPDEDVAPERELAEIADPLSIRRVDIALRTLSRDCSAADQPLPVVRQARLSEHQFELFLAEPAELPAPWLGTNDGTVWTLDAATIQVEDGASVDVPAPYPALVTIGHTTIRGHEAHLLLDLDYVAALGVVGDATLVSEIIHALSLELVTSVWADDLQVTAIGALSELDNALKSGRVHHVASPQPTLDHIDKRCTTDSTALADAKLDLRSARATERLPEVWTPEVLVAAQALSDEQRQQLGSCVARQPRAAISAITAHDSLGEWFLDLDSEDPGVAILQPLGLRIEPQRVSHDVYQAILETFIRADQSPTSTGSEAAATPEPSLASLPDDSQSPLADAAERLDLTEAVLPEAVLPEAETGNASVSATGPTDSLSPTSSPVVKVLGSPEVAGADGPIEATKRARCIEIAAYLALYPKQNPDSLNASLWPGDPSGEYRNVRNGLLSRTRRWLGTDTKGDFWLEYTDGGACTISTQVTTDWAVLKRILPNGPFSASDDELIAAMRLIRGRPFQGVSSQRYGWAVTLIQEMVPQLTDITYELSTRLLNSGRWADAQLIAARGLEIDDLYEPLWRIQILATSRAEGPEAALNQIQQLEAALDHYGLDLEQETLDLMAEIRSPVSQPSPG